MKPIIGITCVQDTARDSYYLPCYYINAVKKAGGIPLLLCPMSKGSCSVILQKIDGLLLSGGPDVDPVFFGEEPSPRLGEITPERDLFELELTRLVLKGKIPMLAICRGIQVLNVAAGGSVIQDIGSQVMNSIKHSQDAPRWYPTHRVNILAESKLKNILGVGKPRVNSFHHQAVKEPAEGFIVSARATDGIIEAIEPANDNFAIGVQWHPECLVNKEPHALKLFKAFIHASVGAVKKKDLFNA